MGPNNTGLQGLKEICAHLGKSEPTVRKLILEEDLPATKLRGEWVSDILLIAQWRRDRIRRRRE